jgi:hypothetical protein
MVEEKDIEPHVPVWEKGERNDGTFSRSEFAFDEASNTLTQLSRRFGGSFISLAERFVPLMALCPGTGHR